MRPDLEKHKHSPMPTLLGELRHTPLGKELRNEHRRSMVTEGYVIAKHSPSAAAAGPSRRASARSLRWPSAMSGYMAPPAGGG